MKRPDMNKAMAITKEMVFTVYDACRSTGNPGQDARNIAAVEADLASLARVFGYRLEHIEPVEDFVPVRLAEVQP